MSAYPNLLPSSIDLQALQGYPHTLALNDPPAGYPNVITSFTSASGFVLPTGAANNASISGGELILTPNTQSQAGIAVYGTPVTVGNGIQATFSYTSTGGPAGNSGDGISFFLLDASKVSSASAVTAGGNGAGLGYSDNGSNGTTNGITDGVLGVGLDTYGNDSAAGTSGGTTGSPSGATPNSVVLRGAGSGTTGYNYLSGAVLPAGIDGTRTVRVTVLPRGANSVVKVEVSTDGGATFTTALDTTVAQAIPSQVYYGFAASTGGATDLHEINSVSTKLVTDPEFTSLNVSDATTGTTNNATFNPGDSVAYTYTVVNNGPNGTSQIVLNDQAPTNLVNETWTVVDDLGTHTGTGPIALSNVNLSAGDTATVTVKGTIDPNATSGNISHQVTATLGAAYTSSNPAGGTTTLALGGNGSTLYLQGADGATTAPGTTASVAPFAAATLHDMAAGGTITVNVHPSSTVLGALSLATGAPLVGTLSATTGDLTFTGTAAQVQAELQDVLFKESPHTAVATTSASNNETYTVTATDLVTNAKAVDARAVTTIDSPEVTGSVGGTPITDGSSTSPYAGVVVGDPDLTTLAATVTVNSTNGDLTAASTMGWTRTASGSTATYTRSYASSGTTPASVALQAGLRALVFQPTGAHALAPNTQVTETFAVAVVDSAGVTNPTLSGTDTYTEVHDTPTVGGTVGGQTITDAGTTSPFASTTLADPDNTPITVSVVETSANGDFTAASVVGWTRTASGNTVTYTQTFAAGNVATAQSSLRGLVFQPTAHATPPTTSSTASFSATATDGLGTSSTTLTGQDSITAVHDTPVLTPTGTTQAISDLGTSTPFGSAVLSDPDNTSITLAVSVLASSGDLTAASTAGWTRTTSGSTIGYSRTYAVGTGSAAAAQAGLRALVYQPTAYAMTPNTSSTSTFTAQATDGAGTASAVISTVDTVTATHNSPTVSGTSGGMAITDGQTAQPYSSISVTEPDNTPIAVKVTINATTGDLTPASALGWTRSSANGTLTYSRTYSAGTGSAAAAQAGLHALVYQPTPHAIPVGSSEVDTFAVQVTDGTGSASASLFGADTVTPVHDAPVLGGTVGGQGLADTSSTRPFASTTLVEPDNNSLAVRVSVNAAHGDLSAASTVGWTRGVVGTTIVYTQTFAAQSNVGAVAQAAVQALVFQPAPHVLAPSTSETDSFALSAVDGSGSATGTLAGSDTITAVHDTPVLAGTVGGQSITDAGTATPFASTTLAEPDDTTLTLVVTENAAHGDLTAASTAGWTRTLSGTSVVYTRTFAAQTNVGAAAQAGLQSLVYQPTAHAVPLGTTESDTFSVLARDGSGLSSSAQSGTITVSPVHDTPVLAGSTASTSIADTATANPYGAATVTDPDDTSITATLAIQAAHGDLSAASATGWTRTQTSGGETYVRTFAAQPGIGGVVQSSIQSLVFQPVPGAIAAGTTETDNLALTLVDGLGAISATGTASVQVASTATTPATFSGTAATQTGPDIGPVAPFAGLMAAEPDTAPAQVQVTIVDGVDHGDLTAASTAGFTRTIVGQDIVYTASLPAQANIGAAVASLASGLVFQSRAVTPGTTQATTINLAATYGTGQGAAQAMDSVLIQSQGSLHPYPLLSAQDSNPDAVLTVSATLPTTVHGHYAVLGTGTGGSDPLTYTVVGTAAQVTAALHAVVFVPDTTQDIPTSYSASIVGDGIQGTLVDAGLGSDALSSLGADETVYAGTGQDTLFSSPTGTSTLVAPGSATYVNGGGTAQVFAGTGGSTFFGGSGTSTMAQSSGNDTFVGGSGNATVYGGTGTSLAFGGTSAFSFYGAQGQATIVGSSGTNTVFGGTGAVSIYGTAGGSGLYVTGSTGDNVILSATGASTLIAAGATDDLVASGPAADLLVAGPGQDTLTGTNSSGDDTYVGASGTVLIAAGTGNSLVVGGSGTESIYAGHGTGSTSAGTGSASAGNGTANAGSLTYFGGSGTDQVVGGTLSDTFAVGSGNETLIGSGGRDSYVLNQGHAGGNIVVEDFKVGTDLVSLFGYKSTEVATAIAHDTVSGGGTSLSFSDGTRLLFVGVSNISGSILHGADNNTAHVA